MPEIKTSARTTEVTLPSKERFLIGQVEIDCPICGGMKLLIPGHHMRGLLRVLAEWVEQHPDLTGPLEINVIRRESFSGQTGGDPTTN